MPVITSRESHVRSYEYYFASGYYDERYPRPNRNVLDTVSACLPKKGGHVIDFGCGTGRYLFPFSKRLDQIAGFDISQSALERLRENAGNLGNGHNIRILGPETYSLDQHVEKYGPADVLMSLFGVLSHVEGVETRRELLMWFRRLIKPETGRIVISVPNRRRRFRKEQKQQGADRDGILYQRSYNDQEMNFFYRLYDIPSFCNELTSANLTLESLHAESLIPESWLANSSLLNRLDRMVAPVVPPKWGYGLLAVVRANPPVAQAEEQWKKIA